MFIVPRSRRLGLFGLFCFSQYEPGRVSMSLEKNFRGESSSFLFVV